MRTFTTLPYGATVGVVDDLHPEDVAMLQALYSRSPKSVQEHLSAIDSARSGAFMKKFYVGYNHKSIADCGSTTLFFETVSLLAAKAIQDFPLYSGQETSTRYLDMGHRAVVDPIDTPESRAIVARWLEFYRWAHPHVVEGLRAQHPRQHPTEPEETWNRAIQARAFDILRGFLPAGITTQLSWHTNLRQAADHLVELDPHPLAEVRSLARAARGLLADAYASSGFDRALAGVSGADAPAHATAARMKYAEDCARLFAYTVPPQTPFFDPQINMRSSKLVFTSVHGWVFRDRPRGSILPRRLDDLGQVTFNFSIDFGSFRDLQRHRHGTVHMPLLVAHAFEPWYIESLPAFDLRHRARDLVHEQTMAIQRLDAAAVDKQYLTALGYTVPTSVTFTIPAAVYVMELRSGKAVHPTLRAVVHRMIDAFERALPFVKLHVDKDPDDWSVRRGDQTILEKEGVKVP